MFTFIAIRLAIFLGLIVLGAALLPDHKGGLWAWLTQEIEPPECWDDPNAW